MHARWMIARVQPHKVKWCGMQAALIALPLPLHPRCCRSTPTDISGYQAPGFTTNPDSRRVIGTKGYLYDATLIEWYSISSATSPSKDQMVWPFTGE